MIAFSAYLLAATLLVLPFVYLNSTIDPVMMPRFLVLTVVLIALALTILVKSHRYYHGFDFSILHRSIFPIFFGYLLLTSISMIQAGNRTEAMFELLRVGQVLIFLIIAALILLRSSAARALCTIAISAGTLLLSLIGICQYYDLGFGWIPGNTIPYGTMTNKNLLATAVAFGLPFCAYAAMRFNLFLRLAATLSVALGIHLVVISRAGSVWVALIIALAVVAIVSFWQLRRRSQPQQKHSSYSKKILLTVILVIVAIIPPLLSDRSIDQRIESMISSGEVSAQERLTLWQKSLEMFVDKPILGVGAGNWRIMIPAYGTEGLRSQTGDLHYQRPHNDYIWILTESGVMALLFYLALFAVSIWYCIRVLRSSASEDDRILMIAMLAGVLIMIVVSFFSYPRERIVLQMLMMTIFAMLTVTYHNIFPIHKPTGSFLKAVLALLMLLVLTLCAIAGYSRLNGEIHTARALQARALYDHQTVVNEINKAESGWITLDPTATPLTWYRGVARFQLEEYDAAFDDFLTAYKHHPYHVHVLNNLATCFELRELHLQAEEYYLRAYEIAPEFEEPLINLAAVYYNMGRYPEALLVLSNVERSRENPLFILYYEAIRKKLQQDWLI